MSKLVDILLEKSLITSQELKDAKDKQKGAKKPLHELLVEMGFLQERELILAASTAFNLGVVDLDKEKIDSSVQDILSYDQVKRYGVLPLRKEDSKLILAMSDPMDIQTLDDIKIITGLEVKPVLSSRESIAKYIEKYYLTDDLIYDLVKNIDDAKVGIIESSSSSKESLNIESLKLERSPVVKIVNLILAEAIKLRASDIHIEPFEDSLEVRFRIDGFLKNMMKIPKKLALAIAARIKIITSLDIAENRKTQDGRAKIKVGRETIDLRISIIPTFYGEKIVIRVLDARQAKVDLNSIGFQEDELAVFEDSLVKPQGMILVTGPTGSGKTSTIYAALSKIKSERVNIITIEDPVEYLIEGINQIEVNPTKEVTFARGLRSILRQDPNVILVGEIRDKETADIAFRSSLTGHLVFSTLHTNNAIASITRLKDIGLDSYIIGSSLILLLSQRLVRSICPYCKEVYQPEKNIFDKFKDLIKEYKVKEFLRGKGCQKCGYSGFLGRSAIFEILNINSQIKELISNNASESAILKEARKVNFRTLAESGVLKVSQKLTTLEEVARVTNIEGKVQALNKATRKNKPIKVLVADDEADIRKIVIKRIKLAGYEAIEASNGQELVDLAHKESPDLVVTDVMMPVLDGVEAVKQLRSDLQTASLPIIMLTAKQDKESELKGIDAGADDYIAKPFDGEKLIARIKMLLRRARQ